MATTLGLRHPLYIITNFDDLHSSPEITIVASPNLLRFLPDTKTLSAILRSSPKTSIEGRIEILPPNYYRQFYHGSLKVASNWFPLVLEVELWSHSDHREDILIGVEKETVYGKPGVVHKSQYEELCDSDSESVMSSDDEEQGWSDGRHHGRNTAPRRSSCDF